MRTARNPALPLVLGAAALLAAARPAAAAERWGRVESVDLRFQKLTVVQDGTGKKYEVRLMADTVLEYLDGRTAACVDLGQLEGPARLHDRRGEPEPLRREDLDAARRRRPSTTRSTPGSGRPADPRASTSAVGRAAVRRSAAWPGPRDRRRRGRRPQARPLRRSASLLLHPLLVLADVQVQPAQLLALFCCCSRRRLTSLKIVAGAERRVAVHDLVEEVLGQDADDGEEALDVR